MVSPIIVIFFISSFFYLLPGKAGIHSHQSRVIARTRQAAASTQFTMVSIVSPSFAFFVFSSSVHRFFHHVCHQSDGNGTSKNCQHHFLFLCSMAAFIFCRTLVSAHLLLCQSCTISRVTRVPISTIVEIISTSFVCLFC